MTAPKRRKPRPRASTTQRGYGWEYQKVRAWLLANNPPCHWCGAPATTADHVPPIHEVGYPHLSLVPACGPCNYGRRRKRTEPDDDRAEVRGGCSQEW